MEHWKAERAIDGDLRARAFLHSSPWGERLVPWLRARPPAHVPPRDAPASASRCPAQAEELLSSSHGRQEPTHPSQPARFEGSKPGASSNRKLKMFCFNFIAAICSLSILILWRNTYLITDWLLMFNICTSLERSLFLLREKKPRSKVGFPNAASENPDLL